MVNRLPTEKRVAILNMLVEGSSMRSTARVQGVSINTVTKLLVEAGRVCAEYHDTHVVGLTPEFIEVDEIWSFCYAKKLNAAKASSPEAGDLWTWVAIDPATRLVVSWHVGDRSLEAAYVFMADLEKRLDSRVQINSDGYYVYDEAVAGTFAGRDVDHAVLMKEFSGGSRFDHDGTRRYSPRPMEHMVKAKRLGNPDLDALSTSYVERHNLTMRMSMRRFTRLTNGFSKKVENHAHMVALYALWYNFCRVHSSLKQTPAQSAGLAEYPQHIRWLEGMVTAAQPAPRRGPYKSRSSN